MILQKSELNKYIKEIHKLQKKYLPDVAINTSVTYFVILDGKELAAVAAVKCYMGHWHLRSCIVKPKYRGRGLQKKLIKERLQYLSDRTSVAKVSALPHNVYSINNLKSLGFKFEKEKVAPNGDLLYQFRKSLTPIKK